MGQNPELGWSFACPDWEERLRTGRGLIPELPLNAKMAGQAVATFNNLRLPDVPNQPSLGVGAGEWQRDIVRAAFGSLDPDTGQRHVRKIFCMVPKKNSKTTGGAGIALTALLLNKRPNAELQLVGPTQEIADLAFGQVWGMIEADPEHYLEKRFQVRDHVKTIVDRNNGAELKIKTFDMKVTTGAKPVFVLLDELHLMSGFSYASRVFGQIQGNMLANPESLFVIITTQSDQPPAGIFRSELQYARGVRDGRITERVRTLPVLYEFPEAVQTSKAKAGQPRKWEDPAIWPMVLPNLGRSLSLDRLIDEFHEAKDKGEEELRRWASQHLNIEIGLGLHADRWRGADHWEQAVHAKVRRLEDLLAACEVAVVGIDGGGLDDLLGVTVIGRIKGSQRWVSWSRAWAEADLLKNRPEIAERLRDFEADKDLVIFELEVRDLTEGDDDVLPPDLAEVADVVLQVEAAGLLPEENAVGLDTAGVAIRLLVEYLKKRKIAEKQMTGVAQGFRLMGAIQCAERKLKERMLVHADQRLMDWCVGNAKAEQKGNNVLITKETAGKAKIDPLAALFNAVELMARNPQPKRKADFSMMFVGGRSAA
ncbi:MAG: terminase large subunit [Phenylobacterium sp.]|nr:terminase large subunit [Phenylobacterium sp.]